MVLNFFLYSSILGQNTNSKYIFYFEYVDVLSVLLSSWSFQFEGRLFIKSLRSCLFGKVLILWPNFSQPLSFRTMWCHATANFCSFSQGYIIHHQNWWLVWHKMYTIGAKKPCYKENSKHYTQTRWVARRRKSFTFFSIKVVRKITTIFGLP